MTFDHDTDVNGIGELLISSRSLSEYRAMFDLTDNDLSLRILDCPGGGAGFTSEVSNLGGDVTACDIAYFENSADELAAIATSEADRGITTSVHMRSNTSGRSSPIPKNISVSGNTLPSSSRLMFADIPISTSPAACRHCPSLMPASI